MSIVETDTSAATAPDQRANALVTQLREQFGDQVLCEQATLTGMPVESRFSPRR
ncbi:hypothetical protein LCGC14_0954060, partial [marine sediment metagenome]